MGETFIYSAAERTLEIWWWPEMLTGWVGDGADELPTSFVSLGSSTSLFLPTSLHPLSLPPCGSRRVPVWDVPPVLRMPSSGVCFTSDQLSLPPWALPMLEAWAGGRDGWVRKTRGPPRSTQPGRAIIQHTAFCYSLPHPRHFAITHFESFASKHFSFIIHPVCRCMFGIL